MAFNEYMKRSGRLQSSTIYNRKTIDHRVRVHATGIISGRMYCVRPPEEINNKDKYFMEFAECQPHTEGFAHVASICCDRLNFNH